MISSFILSFSLWPFGKALHLHWGTPNWLPVCRTRHLITALRPGLPILNFAKILSIHLALLNCPHMQAVCLTNESVNFITNKASRNWRERTQVPVKCRNLQKWLLKHYCRTVPGCYFTTSTHYCSEKNQIIKLLVGGLECFVQCW